MSKLQAVLDELEMLDREVEAHSLEESCTPAPVHTEDVEQLLVAGIADARRTLAGLERAVRVLQERKKHG